MKIHIYTFGKVHKGGLEEEIKLYTKRIQKYYKIEWNIFNTIQLKDPNQIKKKEANIIFEQLHNEDCLIALDEKGKKINSLQFASMLQHQLNSSFKRMIFLIGGSYGLDKTITDKAHVACSLSDLTFPHQMVRLIIVEQIYRACTIIANEKYHHQ